MTRVYVHRDDRAADLAWQVDAACAGVVGFDDPARTSESLALCRRCPVHEPCLALGVDAGGDGVWGGVELANGVPSRVRVCPSCRSPLPPSAQARQRYCANDACQRVRRRRGRKRPVSC